MPEKEVKLNEIIKKIRHLGCLIHKLNLEKSCNCAIVFRINIREVLKHCCLSGLFQKLSGKKIIKGVTSRHAWTQILCANYKKRYKRTIIWKEVRFNIKNNLLWMNGKIDFLDTVYHEVFIPYDEKLCDKSEDEILLFVGEIGDMIEKGVTIRILIVNGFVKLQVGDFSDMSNFAPHKRFVTVTTFPLMYFSYFHKIPERYLNFSEKGMESYWTNEDWLMVGEELEKEFRVYNYLCRMTRQNKRWQKLVDDFDAKKNEWLSKEGFKNFLSSGGSSYEDDRIHNDIDYYNKYLHIQVANYNKPEYFQEHVFSDYCEYRP